MCVNPETINVHDFSSMHLLTKVDLLLILKNRYESKEFFTKYGQTLIFINPLKEFPELFNQKQMDKCIENYKISLKNYINSKFHLDPHIYQSAIESINHLIKKKQNQSILLTGESGSGKTNTVKYLLSFIIYYFFKEFRNCDYSEIQTSLENKILRSSPILEAFGNAKTVINDNSSRFSKMIKIYINPEKGKIIGSKILCLLPEKSRLCGRFGKTERNFHIFYFLINGIKYISQNGYNINSNEFINTRETKDFFSNYFTQTFIQKLDFQIDGKISTRNFQYLKCNSDLNTEKKDVEGLFNIINSMIISGFNPKIILYIFEIIAGITHLGNVDFVENQMGCSDIKNQQQFLKVCELLNFDEIKLKNAMIQNVKVIMNEKIVNSNKYSECISIRDTIAKEIYTNLFRFLYHKINISINPTDEERANSLFINIIDIFGFESIETNSLEQILINYTNEKLQSFYNDLVFKKEITLYEEEGLIKHFHKFDIIDNTKIIDILENQHGIFAAINNESKVTQKDDLLLHFLLSIKNQDVLKKSKLGKNYFTLAHSPYEIDYEVTNFISKNLDDVNIRIKELIYDPDTKSEVNEIIKYQELDDFEKREATENLKFLVSKFKNSIQNTFKNISKTNSVFIRCIKPNDSKAIYQFSPSIVNNQVRWLGILDTVKMWNIGFPIKKTFFNFYTNFEHTITLDNKPNPNNLKEIINACITIISTLIPETEEDEEYLIGKTMLFLTQKLYEKLLLKRNKILFKRETALCRIIIKFRNDKFRKLLKKLRKLVLLLQNKIRAKIRDRVLERFRRSSIFLQKSFRMKRINKRIQINLRLIKILKLNLRNFIFKKRFRILVGKIKLVQKFIRNLEKKFHKKFTEKRKIKFRGLLINLIEEIVSKYFIDRIVKIQTKFREKLFYKKYKESLEIVNTIILNKKLNTKSTKIQSCFRNFFVSVWFKKFKKSVILIQKFFRSKLKKSNLMHSLIKNSNKKDQVNKNSHLSRNRSSLLDYQFKSIQSLFPNYNFKTKNSSRGSTIHTLKKIETLQFYYEKKMLNYRTELCYETSRLTISPFEEPKLHFFIHILDIDILANSTLGNHTWADTIKSVMNAGIIENSPIMGISLGEQHTLALNCNGKVFSWGWNGDGQCGFKTNSHLIEENLETSNCECIRKSERNDLKLNGTYNEEINLQKICECFNVEKPVNCTNEKFKDIMCFEDSSYLISKNDQKLYFFGKNKDFNDNPKEEKCNYSPVLYSKGGTNKFKQIKQNSNITIGLVDDGKISILDYTLINSKSLISIENILKTVKFIQIECGNNFTILVSNLGVIYSFGLNDKGQLGQGDFKDRLKPEPIGKLKQEGIKISQVSVGFKHVLVKTTLNKIYSWGLNNHGQVGNGSFEDENKPIKIEVILNGLNQNFISVCAGLRSSTLLTEARLIFWCGTSGDISYQKNLIEFDYKSKIPELFSLDNHSIVKIGSCFNASQSILYGIITDISLLKNKLNNPQKIKFILKELTNSWILNEIYPPSNNEAYMSYISSKHFAKEVDSNSRKTNKIKK